MSNKVLYLDPSTQEFYVTLQHLAPPGVLVTPLESSAEDDIREVILTIFRSQAPKPRHKAHMGFDRQQLIDIQISTLKNNN